jgi:2-polyprenyl-3-methyl-5-hydroxy-6-metoxy-1,4-benzoquinol methylase
VQHLISDAYVQEQRRLHADPRGYGTKGRKWALFIDQVADHFGLPEILDYGAGQGSLAQELRRLGWEFVAEYDPAIEGKDKAPAPADLVVCTDVLEHVEPDKVDAVVDHLASLARRALFVVISLVPTAKTLSDGRQAHISLHPVDWWVERLERHFRVVEVMAVKPEKQWVATLLKKETP